MEQSWVVEQALAEEEQALVEEEQALVEQQALAVKHALQLVSRLPSAQ